MSPKSNSPRLPAIKRGSDSSAGKAAAAAAAKVLERKKSKSFKGVISTNSGGDVFATLSYSSSLITESPGSIAAVRREQMALQHAQRKMRIAHYGRSKSAKFERVVPALSDSTSVNLTVNKTNEEEKRCSFITANSGMEF